MNAQAHLKRARMLATLLDSQWNIFGIKIGIDPLFDFLPGITSIFPTLLSLYIVYIALTLDIPSPIVGKILTNILIDYFVGIIPFAGFVGDIFFKSNLRNLKLLEDYLNKNKESGVMEGDVL